MHLKSVFIRFYKSFNYDHFTKLNGDSESAKDWEKMEGYWYPYVEIPIDEKVTTIVGANESGKSHLLTAIEKAISGKDYKKEEIKREDFCRYSHFFNIKKGELKFPSFGTEWFRLSDQEKRTIRSICNISEEIEFDRFFLFRVNQEQLTVYLSVKNDYQTYKVPLETVNYFPTLLPHIFRIDANIALPETVPIRRLIKGEPVSTIFECFERELRSEILQVLEEIRNNPKQNENLNGANLLGQSSEGTHDKMSLIIAALGKNYKSQEREKEFELARKLLCEVAEVDPEVLSDLADALLDGKEGYVNGIIEMINKRLSESLNFPKWWVQDKEFCLRIAPRDYDLVFTIRDRTGTEYSFKERSSGLRYFLSYFIQYRAHKPHPQTSEILLMDEPDTYLSSQAQQDLLKIFDSFSNPELGSHLTQPIQVIYVTHSPFLIDKNHPERIRVLEKGVEDEGTRVVKDVARNHYEPLRSAFGAFVGETTFIGNCNLIVEDSADQILIAGAATYLRLKYKSDISDLETVDLNRITIVPSGSASDIPYLVYLARGRDVEQPAVIVLLNSNPSGDEAKNRLQKGVADGKVLLEEEFILQIGDLNSGVNLSDGVNLTDIEDLIPLPICVEASRNYAREVCGAKDNTVNKWITSEAIIKKYIPGKTIFDAIEDFFHENQSKGIYIDKLGLSRSVVDTINQYRKKRNSSKIISPKDLETLDNNFKLLFRYLNDKIRKANTKLTDERISQKIDRIKKRFISDHPTPSKREDAVVLLANIEDILDNSRESEDIRKIIKALRETYNLDTEMVKLIDNYEEFKKGLEKIKYAGKSASQEDDPFS